MPKCKDREELYNGKCRVKCLPNQIRSTRSNRCIDITRFDTQTANLRKAERKREQELEIAKIVGIAEGREEGEKERNKLLNAIILSLIHI